MERVEYKDKDEEDRQAELESRTPVFIKSGVSDLWLEVLQRAIQDVALYSFSREQGNKLSEDELEFEASAKGFLFDDNYRIPFDDYLVSITCSKCGHLWSSFMSLTAGKNSICPKCKYQKSWKYTKYVIIEEQNIVETSLRELLSLWGIENVSGFRKGAEKRIQQLIEKKRAGLKGKNRKEELMTVPPTTRRRAVTVPTKIEEERTKDDKAEGFIKSFDKSQSPGNKDSHYRGNIEPLDFIEDQNLGPHEANIVKYICRYKRKGGLTDLKKAGWYLMRLVKLEESKMEE